jgi:hypothetical protein
MPRTVSATGASQVFKPCDAQVWHSTPRAAPVPLQLGPRQLQLVELMSSDVGILYLWGLVVVMYIYLIVIRCDENWVGSLSLKTTLKSNYIFISLTPFGSPVKNDFKNLKMKVPCPIGAQKI